MQTAGLLWQGGRKSILVFNPCTKLKSEPLLLCRGSMGVLRGSSGFIGGCLRLGAGLCSKAGGSLGTDIRLDGQGAHQASVCFINAGQPLVGLSQFLL